VPDVEPIEVALNSLAIDSIGSIGRYFRITISCNDTAGDDYIDEIFNIEIDYTIGGSN
jgi:hypothetical protein